MAEQQITVRMDQSTWQQILDDLGNAWGMAPQDAEVFESVVVVEEKDHNPVMHLARRNGTIACGAQYANRWSTNHVDSVTCRACREP